MSFEAISDSKLHCHSLAAGCPWPDLKEKRERDLKSPLTPKHSFRSVKSKVDICTPVRVTPAQQRLQTYLLGDWRRQRPWYHQSSRCSPDAGGRTSAWWRPLSSSRWGRWNEPSGLQNSLSSSIPGSGGNPGSFCNSPANRRGVDVTRDFSFIDAP